MAAAAADVVALPRSAAMIVTRSADSANTTPHVSPETPAPITAMFMSSSDASSSDNHYVCTARRKSVMLAHQPLDALTAHAGSLPHRGACLCRNGAPRG